MGGYFGAKLAAAGHDLAFIARGKHLEAMRGTGLRIDSLNGEVRISDSLFTSNPAEFGAADLVLFCVKSYDTETAAKTLAPLIGDTTMILSLQNGVDNPEKIARVWGERRTFAGVVYIGASRRTRRHFSLVRRQDCFRASGWRRQQPSRRSHRTNPVFRRRKLHDQPKHRKSSMGQVIVECAVLRDQQSGTRRHETDPRVGRAQETRCRLHGGSASGGARARHRLAASSL